MAVERIGTEGADIIMVQAGDLPGGIFDGRGGTDTLQLTGDTTGPWALNFNLGAVSTLTNFEIVRGTTTTDIIKLTSAQFAGIATFDAGGTSYIDTIEVEGSAVDLRNKAFIGGTSRIDLLTDGAEVIVNSRAQASMVSATGYRSEFLFLDGVTLTAAERQALHERGFDRIRDASGLTTHDNAPMLGSLGGDRIALTSGQVVRLDAGQNATVTEEYGLRALEVTLSGRSDDWDKLDIDTSGTVTTSPINDSWDKVFVEGVEIGMLMRWGASDRFKFNFNENATPARVQELIHAVTYQNTSPHLPYGQREITWAIEDMAWRKSTVSSFVQFTNDRPTDITLSSTQVAENAANGTVVATVSGTDPNSGDRLTFSLVDNAGGRFAINANGQLVVYDRSRLDYEQATSHTVTIRATDRGGLTVEETFTITLANVDENPTRPTTPTIPTSGNDFVLGSVGRDTIRTGPGIDILTGNRGADKLYGGSSQDFFVYLSVKDSTSGSSGRDTIYDFSRKEKDIIDLTAIDAHTRKGGNQKFLFIGKNNFHQKAGELRYEKVKGGVTVYGDVNGDGKADFGINLQGVTSLSKSDFFL